VILEVFSDKFLDIFLYSQATHFYAVAPAHWALYKCPYNSPTPKWWRPAKIW